MSRADFGRIMQMDANLQKAAQVRAERDGNTRFLREQRERFRMRGVQLREQRFQTEDAIANSVDRVRRQAADVGEALRQRQHGLRSARGQQQRAWEVHGRGLTEKFSTRGNQERVRTLKADMADERARIATEMRTFLKQAKKETDDDIYEVNCERARRVYAETSHPVIRVSKQTTVFKQWDQAAGVRQHVKTCKQQIRENDRRYLERAWAIKHSSKTPSDSAQAAQARQDARVAYARQQTQWRKDIAAQRQAVAEGVRSQNRTVRDKVDYGHLVPEREVVGAVLSAGSNSPRNATAGGEDPFSLFSRFFGFRRTQRPAMEPTDELQPPGASVVRV